MKRIHTEKKKLKPKTGENIGNVYLTLLNRFSISVQPRTPGTELLQFSQNL